MSLNFVKSQNVGYNVTVILTSHLEFVKNQDHRKCTG